MILIHCSRTCIHDLFLQLGGRHAADRPFNSSSFDFAHSGQANSMSASQNASLKRKRPDDQDGLEDGVPISLPSALMYEKSYMHRDHVRHLACSTSTGYIITADGTGYVKFWKKLPAGIEFVKNFKAFVGAVVSASLSVDGHRYVAAGAHTDASGTSGFKGLLRFWDVSTFDIVDFRKLSFVPGQVCWVHPRGSAKATLAVSDRHSPDVHLFDADAVGQPAFATAKLHASPVACMAYSPTLHLVISIDGKGIVESWCPTPASSFTPPPGTLSYSLKMDSDAYVLAKAKALPLALAVAPSGEAFVVQSSDGRTRVFTTRSCKVAWESNDSVEEYERQSVTGELPVPMEEDELALRASADKEMREAAVTMWKAATAVTTVDKSQPTVTGAAPIPPAVGGCLWDEDGEHVLFSCLLGVKVAQAATGKLVTVLGAVESTERFTCLALYQGLPKVTSQQLLARDSAALSAPMTRAIAQADPTLIAGAFRRNRFYLLTRREPDEKAGVRDVLNEPPSQAELAALAGLAQSGNGKVGGAALAKVAEDAVIHTTSGDIHVKMYPKDTPKAVENFATLSRRDYYNGLLWHRVIKGFMIQGGDPAGDGTGGESCWGKPFDDETVPHIEFKKPGMLAMANAGPCTNGSQFFISTAPCTWLNGKHTIFGHVTRGMEVVRLLEAVKTDKHDRPLDDIRILGVTVKA